MRLMKLALIPLFVLNATVACSPTVVTNEQPSSEPIIVSSPSPTAEIIGRAFLERTGYLIAFELASVLLLIVVVGAVYIARHRRES